MRHRLWLLVALSVVVVLTGIFLSVRGVSTEYGMEFDGARAYADAAYQVSLGPRTPGSAAHDKLVEWLLTNLRDLGWVVEIQETQMLGKPIRNVIAKQGQGQPWIILGAHYDSRLLADHDPDVSLRQEPVPGANDGASGVAVLMELARVLPHIQDGQLWLVFFDAEDNGHIEGWDWIMGSRAFAGSLQAHPQAVVIVDMIGDADLNIHIEANSDQQLSAEIWHRAAALGYDEFFIDSAKYSILDDHTPFLELGIPAVDVIDFDYPYWHTTEDTLDKISADSLQIVGDTLLNWVLSKLP